MQDYVNSMSQNILGIKSHPKVYWEANSFKWASLADTDITEFLEKHLSDRKFLLTPTSKSPLLKNYPKSEQKEKYNVEEVL